MHLATGAAAATATASDYSFAKPRISREHFAIARGWIQGVELPALAARYLVDSGVTVDLRIAKTTLEYVLDELAAAARRTGRGKDGALLKRQGARIRLPASAPTLEAFAAQLGGADFYSEAELVEMYQAEHGTAGAGGSDAARRAQQRRERLMQRQLALLDALEREVGAAMTRATPVAERFRERISDRLMAAGLMTVGQLADRIASGAATQTPWHRGIRGIGEEKARAIEQVLRGGGIVMPPSPALPGAAAAPLPAAYGIVPLERLVVPASLDGSAGQLRAPRERCLIAARDDRQAIEAFLATRSGVETNRAYRKELERFVLWCVVERQRAVSDLSAEEALAYVGFLVDPQPRSQWCAPRGRPRFSAEWRPFEGPLSPRSQAYAVAVLRTFFEWATRVRYLDGNPWLALGQATAAREGESARSASASQPASVDTAANARFRPLERALSARQWSFVSGQIGRLADDGRARRLRFVLAFGYSTGLRLTELVRAQIGHLTFLPSEGDDPGGWTLRVVGKGNRLRAVPLLDEVVEALRRYLEARGLSADFGRLLQGTFLIGKRDDLFERMPAIEAMLAGQRQARARRQSGRAAPAALLSSETADLAVAPEDGIKAATLYAELKAFFLHCAGALAASGDRGGAERLSRASTHWLRHTYASHALAVGVSLSTVREILGHASLATTSQYVTTEARTRMREMRRLSRLLPGRA